MNVGQIYGTGTGIATQTIPAPDVETRAEDPTFWGEVDRFKRKADEAITLWQKLREKRLAANADARLRAEYDDVMGEAEQITGKVSDVEKAVAAIRSGVAEKIVSWLPESWGLNDYQERMRLGALGVAPVVVALVSAAVAWISTWLSKAYMLDRKLDAVERMIAEGTDPRTAGDIVATRGAPGPFDILAGKAGTGIALAAVAAVALFFLMPRGRR